MKKGVGTGGRGGVSQAAFGLVLIAVGIALLLNQLDLIRIRDYFQHWPIAVASLFSLMAVVKLVAPRPERDIKSGVDTLMFVGWFLACYYHWLGLTWLNSWPLIIVAIGVGMIVKALLRVRPGESPAGGKESHHA